VVPDGQAQIPDRSRVEFELVGNEDATQADAHPASPVPEGDRLFVAGAVTNVGGLASSLAEFRYVRGEQWRAGRTLRDGSRPWYSAKFAGNGATGSPEAVLRRALPYRVIGRGFFVAGAVMTGAELVQGATTPLVAAQDIAFGAAGTFGGVPGVAASAIYFGSKYVLQMSGVTPERFRTAGPGQSNRHW